jgi:hypothetical protein
MLIPYPDVVLRDNIALARRTKHDDIHNRLMQAYEPVPNSWYIVTLGTTFAAAGEPVGYRSISLTVFSIWPKRVSQITVVLVETNPLQTPIWMLALAVIVAGVFLAPIGIITAVSNTTIGLNVLTEL